MAWVAGRAPLAIIVALLVPSVASAAGAHAAALGPAPGTRPLQLVIPLAADDAGLRQFALSVSNPRSPIYGRYASVTTLARRFGASPVTRAAVVRYLRAVGASAVKVNATGMFVEATMSVALAARTFATPLASFRGADGERFVAPAPSAHVSAAGPRLPRPLQGLALGVVGLDTRRVVPLPGAHLARRPRRALAHAAAAQPASDYGPLSGTPGGCARAIASGGFTPNQYLGAYDYAPLRTAGLGGQGQRVAVIEIDGFKYSDLTTFARCFGLRVPSITTYSVGSSKPLPPGEEATLDLEVLAAAAPQLDSLEVFESNGNAAQVDQAFVAPLIAPGAKPQVISASLGLCEADMRQAFGRSGIRSVQRGLELAAATGITVVAASGDTGSAECADFRGNPVAQLAVNYPASSPWVTAVGGTNLHLNPANQIEQQLVWNDTTDQLGAGGGGLSGLFSRPVYQQDVVPQNRRAVPDVSMLADVAPGYAIYCTASGAPGCAGWTTIGGTSAATPLLAGGIALVDQDLHRHEREFLGFLNPLLYAIGGSSAGSSVFSDVVAYGNEVGPYIPGASGRALGCCTAAPGFDEASGWGSLDLARFDGLVGQVLPKFGNVSLSIPVRQRPVKKHALMVRLSCSDTCSAYAFGVIMIAHGRTFALRSRNYAFRGNGTKLVSIKFSRRQESALRAALGRRRKISAEVFGAGLDGVGQVAKVTAGSIVTIRS